MAVLKAFRIFRRGQDAVSYLTNTLPATLRDVQSVLRNLSFSDNFGGFIAQDVEIEAGSSATIENELKPRIPTQRLILRQTGNGVITDGTWQTDSVEINNEGAETVTVTLLFME